MGNIALQHVVNVVKGSEKRLEVVFVKVVNCVFNIPFGN